MHDTDPRLIFLRQHGAAELGHSYQTLLDHLLGTRALLKAWGASEVVCDAGLFHSVYGTEIYRHETLPLELRPEVQQVIGIDAERLAFLFGMMTRESFSANEGRTTDFALTHRYTGETLPLDPHEWTQLCEIFMANALEQLDRVMAEKQASFYQRYRWTCPFLSAGAVEAFEGRGLA